MVKPIPNLPGYFEYTPSQGWECGICYEVKDEPIAAHRGGEGHAFHVSCTKKWYETHKNCVYWCDISPRPRLFKEWLPQSLAKLTPRRETFSGLSLLTSGIFKSSPLLTFLGCLLQAHGVQRVMTSEGNGRIRRVKEIRHFATSLLHRGVPFPPAELNLLRQQVESNLIFSQKYQEIRDQFQSGEEAHIGAGLRTIVEVTDRALRADKLLFAYQILTIAGSLLSFRQLVKN